MKYPYKKICFDCIKKITGESYVNKVSRGGWIAVCPVCGKKRGCLPTEDLNLEIKDDTIFKGVPKKVVHG